MAESCYGCIVQIFESLKKSQREDMSAIQTELCKMSTELYRVRECQSIILQMFSSERLDISTMNLYKANTAEPQNKMEVSNDTFMEQTPKRKLKQSRVLSLDRRHMPEFQILHQHVLEDGSYSVTDVSRRSQPDLETPSITCNVTGDEYDLLPDIDSLRQHASTKIGDETSITHTHLGTDMSFIEPQTHSREDGTVVQSNPSLSACPERNESSVIRSIFSKSSRLLFPQPHAVAMGSLAQIFFDDRLPKNRTARKRILSCYGTCGEGSAVNALWRKFLLAMFGIQDDEAWTGKIGSAVIHPDSSFHRGEKRDGRKEGGECLEVEGAGRALCFCARV
jgi:hypothetical protein